MRIEVDKRYPNRWREEPYYTQICELALDGLKSEKFRTMVRVGHDGDGQCGAANKRNHGRGPSRSSD